MLHALPSAYYFDMTSYKPRDIKKRNNCLVTPHVAPSISVSKTTQDYEVQ